MISNALNTGVMLPRPPAVCIAPPKPPIRPLDLWIDVYPNPCSTGEGTTLEWWGDHPARPTGEPVSSVWDPGLGTITETPPTNNRQQGLGAWLAPDYPCKTTIKCTSTWVDGTVAFTYIDVEVLGD